MTIQNEHSPIRFSIATFNIRTDTSEDGPPNGKHRWDNRFPFISELIHNEDWDIIGFQEVRSNQLKDLSTLSKYKYVGQKRSDRDSGEYNPIFFKEDKFLLLESYTKWLSPTPCQFSKADEWEASLPRIFTYAHLLDKQKGKSVHVINTHFDHISEEARYQSSHLIGKMVDHIEPSHPVFLLGDFNGEQEERWYRVISQRMSDAEKLSQHHVGPHVTCTGVLFDYIPKWEDMLKIDFIFVNEHVNVERTKMLTDKYYGSYPSDHLPVTLICSV